MQTKSDVLSTVAQDSGCDKDFIQGLLLRLKVEGEINSSDNWLTCPRCGGQMWRSNALCDECEVN